MSQGETGQTGARGAVGAEGTPGVAGAAGAEGAVGRTGLQGEAGPAAILDPETARTIKASLRTLVVATVVLFLMLFGVVIWTYVDSGSKRDSIAKVAVTTKKALCSLRHGHQVKIQVSKQFLKENPQGIPGITAKQIQQGIDDEQLIVKSLEDLKCP